MVTSDDGMVASGSRILIIEPDVEVCNQLTDALQKEEYAVLTAQDGPTGLRHLFAYHPHLIILALVLPVMDGWTVLERIRDATDTPVLILSKRRHVSHRLRAFELRAQDYITKPFDTHEVVLRAKSLLDHWAAVQRAPNSVFDDGVLRIDPWNRTVSVHGQPLDMSHREQYLLGLLIRQPGRLVTYDEILETLRNAEVEDPGTALRSLIYRLRRKLEEAAPGTNYILTHRGVGVKLDVK